MNAAPALPRDYFVLFELNRKLSIDEAALQHRFYELSRLYHPDRFAARSPAEQQLALDYTAFLNDGYRIMRDPVRRAEYLLSQEGFDIGEQRSKDVPPELLEEVFELNMMLESADRDSGELEASRERFQTMLADTGSELKELFSRYDSDGSKAVLSDIRGVLNRRRYIQNLVRDVEKALA